MTPPPDHAPPADDTPPAAAVEAFIARWKESGGGELANTQTFLNELCDLIGVQRPLLVAAHPVGRPPAT